MFFYYTLILSQSHMRHNGCSYPSIRALHLRTGDLFCVNLAWSKVRNSNDAPPCVGSILYLAHFIELSHNIAEINFKGFNLIGT